MRFCDNEYCEHPAVKRVPVSEDEAGDSTRWFCEACENAYAIGVQHGTLTERPRQASSRP
jgi:hypothetical protein